MSKIGSVSLENMRLSLVNGAAFVDVSVAEVLTPYTNCLLTITDAAGKKAQGYIKAPGIAETYGPELLVNGSFNSTVDNWSAEEGHVSLDSGGQSGNCLEVTEAYPSGIIRATQPIISPLGAFLHFSGYQKPYSITDMELRLINADTNITMMALPNEDAVYAWKYYSGGVTAPSPNLDVELYALASVPSWTHPHAAYFDTLSLRQVLTPSVTGVTITSTPGGTTYNWAVIETGFNYNDPAGYAYEITGSVRKMITALIYNRVKSILTTAGYNTNVGNNVYAWPASNLPATALPAIILRDTGDSGGDIITIAGPIHSRREHALNIEFDLIASGLDVPNQLRDLMDDLTAAIGIDPTWEGLAIYTDCVSDDMTIEQHEETIGSCKVTMSITYRTKLWDLKTQ